MFLNDNGTLSLKIPFLEYRQNSPPQRICKELTLPPTYGFMPVLKTVTVPKDCRSLGDGGQRIEPGSRLRAGDDAVGDPRADLEDHDEERQREEEDERDLAEPRRGDAVGSREIEVEHRRAAKVSVALGRDKGASSRALPGLRSAREAHMADFSKSVAGNVAGEFFVDTTCIDCDTCRQLAPATFGDDGEHAFVQLQPRDAAERRAALRALVACPTGSIGTQPRAKVQEAIADFPMPIDEAEGVRVAYCGFTSPDSFGASSYFVEHEEGNWLVDSPRWSTHLEKRFEERGGIARIFLTHQDDVADAARWAERFGAQRILHRHDLGAQPDAEIVLEGEEPTPFGRDFLAIPTPGHTRGHAVLLARDRWLFTGDHAWWSRGKKRLWASRSVCWYDWGEQTQSMEKLLAHRFEWILPGHGERLHLPADAMRRELASLVETMRGIR